MNEIQNTSETVNTAPQQTPDSVINLNDLQNVLVVIDLASNRGAFRGPELQPVGQLYDKINRFLQSAIPPKTEEFEGSTTATQTSEVTSEGV
jgi:hypothetical protein